MSSPYSSTPLAKKLGIKSGHRLLLLQTPPHYRSLFSDWPEDCELLATAETESADVIHVFCQRQEELQELAPSVHRALKKNGSLWISWPKGASRLETDLKRDWIREFWLDRGLVDVKVAAIDADWSGLKFVYRLIDR